MLERGSEWRDELVRQWLEEQFLDERGVPGRSTGLICTRMVSCELHSRTSGVMVGLPE